MVKAAEHTPEQNKAFIMENALKYLGVGTRESFYPVLSSVSHFLSRKLTLFAELWHHS